jgi:hypothetical protein
MLRPTLAAAIAFGVSVAALAGQTDPSIQRIRAALEAPAQGTLSIPTWVQPVPTKLGMFALLQPQAPGEVVRVFVPIGEIVTRATRAIGDARRRRAERESREKVLRDLRAVEAQASR